jgi:hypothetical protein
MPINFGHTNIFLNMLVPLLSEAQSVSHKFQYCVCQNGWVIGHSILQFYLHLSRL